MEDIQYSYLKIDNCDKQFETIKEIARSVIESQLENTHTSLYMGQVRQYAIGLLEHIEYVLKKNMAPFIILAINSSTNRVVGYNIIGVDYYNKVIEVSILFVVESYRKFGIGNKLMTAVIQHAKIQQFDKVELYTLEHSETSPIAIHLYEKLGFKRGKVKPPKRSDPESFYNPYVEYYLKL